MRVGCISATKDTPGTDCMLLGGIRDRCLILTVIGIHSRISSRLIKICMGCAAFQEDWDTLIQYGSGRIGATPVGPRLPRLNIDDNEKGALVLEVCGVHPPPRLAFKKTTSSKRRYRGQGRGALTDD